MIVTDLIQEVYTAYRGKGASKTPIAGSEKYATALAIANRKQGEWATDTNQVWVSNFRSDLTPLNQPGTVATTGTTALTGTGTFFTDFAVGDQINVSGETVRTIATITSDTALTVTPAFTNTASGLTFTRTPIVSATKEYSVHRNFIVPSDTITVTTATQDLTYNFTSPQNRTQSDVYLYGRNPKKLAFYNAIETQAIGGTLRVPGYYKPDSMVNATDIVAVDDPYWLVYITAAELSRNDPAKEDQFANLVAMANERYMKMIDANIAQGAPQAMIVPTDAPILGDQTNSDVWAG
jgi:hypothetical protein